MSEEAEGLWLTLRAQVWNSWEGRLFGWAPRMNTKSLLTGKVSLVAPFSAAARRCCKAEALGDPKEKGRRDSNPLAFHLPWPGCYQNSAIYLAKFLAN